MCLFEVDEWKKKITLVRQGALCILRSHVVNRVRSGKCEYVSRVKLCQMVELPTAYYREWFGLSATWLCSKLFPGQPLMINPKRGQLRRPRTVRPHPNAVHRSLLKYVFRVSHWWSTRNAASCAGRVRSGERGYVFPVELCQTVYFTSRDLWWPLVTLRGHELFSPQTSRSFRELAKKKEKIWPLTSGSWPRVILTPSIERTFHSEQKSSPLLKRSGHSFRVKIDLESFSNFRKNFLRSEPGPISMIFKKYRYQPKFLLPSDFHQNPRSSSTCFVADKVGP